MLVVKDRPTLQKEIDQKIAIHEALRIHRNLSGGPCHLGIRGGNKLQPQNGLATFRGVANLFCTLPPGEGWGEPKPARNSIFFCPRKKIERLDLFEEVFEKSHFGENECLRKFDQWLGLGGSFQIINLLVI